jgi:ribonuclease HII
MTPRFKHANFKKNTLENELWSKNRPIIGIDEVGRGCLAGPVVTAAVCLPPYTAPDFLLDSKIMTVKERCEAYEWIVAHCIFSLGIVNHTTIDAINIWHATLRAMKKAALHITIQLPQLPGAILVDAMPLSLSHTTLEGVPVHSYIQGETWSSSIAAASIVAKVTRDRLMVLLDAHFPRYYLAQHKGYSTPLHKTSILTERHSIIHRLSFLHKIITSLSGIAKATTDSSIQEHYHDYDQQQSLW